MVRCSGLKQSAFDVLVVLCECIAHFTFRFGIADERAIAVHLHHPCPDQARHIIFATIHDLAKSVCRHGWAFGTLTAFDLGKLRKQVINGFDQPHGGLWYGDIPRFKALDPFVGIAALMLAWRQHGKATLSPYINAHAGLVGG